MAISSEVNIDRKWGEEIRDVMGFKNLFGF